MALKTHKLAAATAVAAAFSLLAMPVAAVELPRPAAVKAYDGEGLNVERDRRRSTTAASHTSCLLALLRHTVAITERGGASTPNLTTSPGR